LEAIRKSVSNYIRFLPGPITPQKYSNIDSDMKINATLYGRILEEIIDKFDHDWPLNENGLDPLIKQLIIVNGATIFILSECLRILTAALNKSEDKKAIYVIVMILEDLLKSDAIFSSIVDTCRYGPQTYMQEEELDEACRSAVQVLISLPNRISNKLQFDTPKFYTLQIYSKALYFHIFCAISFVNDGLRESNIKPRVTALSFLISKIIISLKPINFSCFTDIIEKCCFENKRGERYLIESIFRSLDSTAIEYVATLFLKHCNPKIGVHPIFGNLLTESNWKYILMTKIPLMRYYDDAKLAINLISYLSSFSNEHGMLSELLIKLLEVWSDGSILNHAHVDQRRYIAQLIILSIKSCKDHLSKDEIDQCQKLLLSGISIHLECTNIYLRAMGMITGEICINALSTADAPKLEFEYNNMTTKVSKLVESLKNLSTLNLIIDVKEQYECDDELTIGDLIFDSLRSKKIYQLGIDCGILSNLKKVLEIEDNICLPKTNEADNNSIEKNETQQMTENSNDNSDLDSDDDLVPYVMTDDLMKPNKVCPLYLRDVRDNLTDEQTINDPDVFTESLLACDKLIQTQLSNDDVSFAIELLQLLLTLKQQTYVENFESLIFNCCVRIVIICPREGAEYLCKEFYEDVGKYSLNQRLLFLDVLAESAKRLSEINIDETNSTNDNIDKAIEKKQIAKHVSLFINMKDRKKQEWYINDIDIDLEVLQDRFKNWREIVDKRIASHTRRFAESSKSPKMHVNQFANVASSFFYPLLYGFDRKDAYKFKSIKIYSDQMNILLLRYLKTLSTIMLAAQNCILAPKMGKEILELTWTLRHHTEAPVRLAVTENIGSVLITVPQDAIINELLPLVLEIREWLMLSQNIIHGEHDVNCRILNEKILSLIDYIIGCSFKVV